MVYGSYQDDSFIIALQAPVAIGANTTLWFNTDNDPVTGHDIFGAGTGADYNINFDSSGVPVLYTGDAGATPVAGAPSLEYAVSPDGTILEIALPSALVNGSRAAELFVDVNNDPFLPAPYAAGGYLLDDVSIFV